MSKKGDCYDNAVTESWFASFKTEAIPEAGIFTHVEAQLVVFEQIEAFYNTVRPHSTLGFINPVDFEKQTRFVA